MGNRAAILGLVEKAWGKTGTEAPSEESITRDSQANQQQPRSGSGQSPGYGRGKKKPVVLGPPRRP